MNRTLPWLGIGTLLLLAIGMVLYFRNKMGTWIWPATGRISSPFGPRVAPVTGASTLHNGIDIALPIGTEVKAPADGTITSIFSNSAGGKQLIITHKNGWKTGYAHLSEFVAALGDDVKQGDVVARSGNTGTSSGPHLHFTMSNAEGQKVDPMKYLA